MFQMIFLLKFWKIRYYFSKEDLLGNFLFKNLLIFFLPFSLLEAESFIQKRVGLNNLIQNKLFHSTHISFSQLVFLKIEPPFLAK